MLTTREAIRGAWQQRAQCEQDWSDIQRSSLLRLTYTIKAIICLALNRYKEYNYSDDVVEIAYFGYHHTYGEYPGADWDALRVGRGTFSNWYVDFIPDGYP